MPQNVPKSKSKLLPKLLKFFLFLILIPIIFLFVINFFYLLKQKKVEIKPGEVTKSAGTYEVSINHDNLQRRYLLHVPSSLQDYSVPLVIVLHGAGEAVETVDTLTGMNLLSEREGFLVAYPAGIKKQWNDGRDPKRTADDVGFIKKMVEDVSNKFTLDTKRIYVGGMSNGAFMSARLACEASGNFAAFGLVDGLGGSDFTSTCKPRKSVPMIIFMGTEDPIVPFEGGRTALFGIRTGRSVISAVDFVNFMKKNNSCKTSQTKNLEDIDKNDRSTVTLEINRDCKENGEIDFYQVIGGGHTWPDGPQYAAPFLIGNVNRDVNASELMWEFFKSHSLETL